MVVNFSKTCLQVQKHMIFVLGGAESRERKLLKLDTILEKVPGQKSLKFTVKKNKKIHS